MKILALTLGVIGVVAGGAYAVHAQRQPAQPHVLAMDVYKTPTCGCCTKWVDHMRAAGFQVTARDVSQAELDTLKAKHGVPPAMHSCHTGLIDGYAIEGHIPAREVLRFLKERPAVAGLAVPGMPLGSPGMEVPGVTPRPYTVMTFDRAGQTQVFSTVKP
ncbi:DUF411 domain-containing protein [soil metagenome]